VAFNFIRNSFELLSGKISGTIFVQETTSWALEPMSALRKILPYWGSNPNRPARSKPLFRLRYSSPALDTAALLTFVSYSER